MKNLYSYIISLYKNFSNLPLWKKLFSIYGFYTAYAFVLYFGIILYHRFRNFYLWKIIFLVFSASTDWVFILIFLLWAFLIQVLTFLAASYSFRHAFRIYFSTFYYCFIISTVVSNFYSSFSTLFLLSMFLFSMAYVILLILPSSFVKKIRQYLNPFLQFLKNLLLCYSFIFWFLMPYSWRRISPSDSYYFPDNTVIEENNLSEGSWRIVNTWSTSHFNPRESTEIHVRGIEYVEKNEEVIYKLSHYHDPFKIPNKQSVFRTYIYNYDFQGWSNIRFFDIPPEYRYNFGNVNLFTDKYNFRPSLNHRSLFSHLPPNPFQPPSLI